jgi:hypothetical protein
MNGPKRRKKSRKGNKKQNKGNMRKKTETTKTWNNSCLIKKWRKNSENKITKNYVEKKTDGIESETTD